MKLLLLLFFCNTGLYAQISPESYSYIRSKYERLPTEDATAMPWVKKYIAKAKSQKDDIKLVQGYRDAVQFSSDVNIKLKYADSTVYAALKTENNDLLAGAYLGKGIVYYFNRKKYSTALDQYLIAQKYAEKAEDEYTLYKIIYHIGVVRSYLGNYREAAENFQECIIWHKKQIAADRHPNAVFNSTKGMLNAMHQLAVCYRYLGNYSKAEEWVTEGLKISEDDPDFLLEFAYFTKCRGIVEYHKKNDNSALYFLKKSIPQIKKRNDFAWLSVIYFYLGEIYRRNKDQNNTLVYFNKIDSIYTQHDFILPEVRPAYELMIEYYEHQNDEKKALHYSAQLLKADKSMQRDFTYLFSKISREYDKRKFNEEKNKLEKRNFVAKITAAALLLFTLFLFFFIFWRRRKEKKLLGKYRNLKMKMELQKQESDEKMNVGVNKRARLSESKYKLIEDKIKKFEDSRMYLEKGITVDAVAKKIGTNEAYLSRYINDKKELKFNRYIDELRITELIRMMDRNPKMVHFDRTALTDAAGYGNPQTFNKAFTEVTGLQLSKFLELRRKDRENRKTE